MALQQTPVSADEKTRLLKLITGLLKKKVILLRSGSQPDFHVAFLIKIQVVPKKQLDDLRFGRPEGVRVFIACGTEIVTALDFFYVKTRLRFSAAHSGRALNLLLRALNALEKKYRDSKVKQEVQLVHFLLDPYPYLWVKSGRDRTYYHYPKSRLREIKSARLNQHIQKLLKDHVNNQ